MAQYPVLPLPRREVTKRWSASTTRSATAFSARMLLQMQPPALLLDRAKTSAVKTKAGRDTRSQFTYTAQPLSQCLTDGRRTRSAEVKARTTSILTTWQRLYGITITPSITRPKTITADFRAFTSLPTRRKTAGVARSFQPLPPSRTLTTQTAVHRHHHHHQ